MRRVTITLECLCPDEMETDEFGEAMLCRIEEAPGIVTVLDGQLTLAPKNRERWAYEGGGGIGDIPEDGG